MDHFNLETLAVSFSIAYVIFAAFEKKVCWWFGLAGSLIYIFIFYDVNLYMESCLLYTSPSPRDSNLSRMPSSA